MPALKIILLLSIVPTLVFSEIFVMVSINNKLTKVSKKEITDLYLKKRKQIRGIPLTPIDNREHYEEFCQKVMNKSPRQMRAYWARELYRGIKQPPKVQSSAQIKKTLQRNSNVISYASSKLTGKILLHISK